ncbi:MAG TPA: TetR/AcrR family transcriptional regulator [Chloroflexia bacterium]|nr:TetR/AcrR family transcriptional regulator [Chloroflexia bacterium]
MTRQAERTEATKARLLEVTRRLFVERGYNEVPAEELVREAGLTRGALYHHFGGKDGLFTALYEQIQREVNDRIDRVADAAPDPWSALVAACHEFLECSVDPEVQRITLLDAPAVLSWDAKRELDARYCLGALKEGLRVAQESGAIRLESLDATAHLLLGAMTESAMWIARSHDPSAALAEAKAGLERMLEGLRGG